MQFIMFHKGLGGGTLPKWLFGHVAIFTITPDRTLEFSTNDYGDGNGNWYVGPVWNPSFNTWHHCVVTRQNSVITLYIDGGFFSSDITTNSIDSSMTTPLQIGNGDFGPKKYKRRSSNQA